MLFRSQTRYFSAADAVGDTSGEAMSTALSDRALQLSDTQDGLRFLAAETGGFAIVNSNDIAGGVKRVLEDQSYYLVGYEPDSDTFDAAKRKFNQLTIKVLRKGVNVRYRSGFFNVAERERPAAAPSNATPQQQLTSALVSPFAVSGVDLRLNALFGEDAKSGTFVRSLLHINARDLTFNDQKDGTKKATIEVLAMSFGDNGQVIDQMARGYSIVVKANEYKRMLDEGFVYQFTFPVKKPGAYQYRVAVRDAIGGNVGSASQFIEVPSVKKDRLAVSSILLQNVSAEQWQGISSGVRPDTAIDTALRRVRGNSVLRYGYEIYGARLDSEKHPHLTTRVRIFRDGKVFFEGKDTAVNVSSQGDLDRVKATGALAIGKMMQAGDYVLQVVVTDALAKGKGQMTTQFVEFEVVN